MARIIIEGMQQDQSRRLSYIAEEAAIEADAQALSVGNNTLSYVGVYRQETQFLHEGTVQGPTFVLRQPGPAAFMQHDSPQTVLVEDGRVFTCADPARLDCMLEDLYRAGGFERIFADCKKDPIKMFD